MCLLIRIIAGNTVYFIPAVSRYFQFLLSI